MSDRRVSVCVVPVGESPRIVMIPATLEAQQAIVGGLIQPLDLEGGLSLVVNEEGLLLGLPVNLHVDPWGDLHGPIYFARWDSEGEISSLRYEDMDAILDLIESGRVS